MDGGNYRIIDAHCHIYPSKIAEKAVKAIGDFYNIPMSGDGLSDTLVAMGSQIGVEKYVVHSTATTVKQVRSINEYIKGECTAHNSFIGFMTLHQDMTVEEIAAEVDFCVAAGMKGVKLHPDFQKFYLNSATNIFDGLAGRLPVLLHMGDKRYDYSAPWRLAELAKKYPAQRFIAAHFGGYSVWDATDCLQGLPNVWFDTSSSLAFLSPEEAAEKIRRFGAEKFLFGSDFPMWEPAAELERFLKLGLSEKQNEDILYNNAARLIFGGSCR